MTPREVLEAFVVPYRAKLAAEDEKRRAEAEEAASRAAERNAGRNSRARGGDNRVKRCRAYLAKMEPSVEGNDGSGQMIQAARVIWNDFGIDEAEGYPLLQEYNLRSQPVWGEEGGQGLRRKWAEAVEKGPDARGRGWRLQQDECRDAPGYGDRVRAERAGGGVRTSAPSGGSAGDDPPAVGGDCGLPLIVSNRRHFRDIEAEALAALVRANDPPRLFVGNGCGLVRLRCGDPEEPLSALELTPGSMRSVLSQAADFVNRPAEGDDVPAFPPPAVITSVLERGEWPGVPFLRSIVPYPVFAGPEFELHAATGYYPRSRLFVDLGDLRVPDVPKVPTAVQVAAARELLVDNMMGDFPFIDQASRANAVAALILPTVRHAIKGPTPLAVFDAPAAGTGKSLLAECVFGVTLGEVPEATSADMDDIEWNKYLLAELMTGAPVVYLDNANRKLDSGAMASALTARTKRGRILGATQMGKAVINVCWLLTSNNFECSQEIARRVYWSRIDRKVEDPAAAEVPYRHADLNQWVSDHRPELLAAIVTLVNNWIATGKKPGTARLGKFERWAAVIGGILEAAGIGGFLGNAAHLRQSANVTIGEWAEFLARWYEQHSGTQQVAYDLFELGEATLETVIKGQTEQARRTHFGNLLRANRDKVYGGYQIKECLKADGKPNRDHKGRPRYRLERVVSPETATKATATFDEYSDSEEEFEVVA